MNVRHLSVRGMRTFDEIDLPIPAGVTALIGPNGSGKSTILNAIDVALFCERGELTQLRTVGADLLEIQLEFEHAGELYRVRRQLAGSRSPTCDLETLGAKAEVYTDDDGTDRVRLTDDGEWRPLTRSSADETTRLLCETIGLTRPTFRASSFLRQGDTAAFTEATPADRKRVLAEICTLDEWATLHERCRTAGKQQQRQLDTVTGRIDAHTAVVATKPEVDQAWQEATDALAEANREAAAAEQLLQQTVEARAAHTAHAERAAACQTAVDAATADLNRATAALDEAEQADRLLEGLRIDHADAVADAAQADQLDAQLADLRQQDDQARQAVRERDRLTARAAELEHDLARLTTDREQTRRQAETLTRQAGRLRDNPATGDVCDRCHQHLDTEARAATIVSLTADANRLLQQLETSSPVLAALQQQAADARRTADLVTVPPVVDVEPAVQALAAARKAAVTAATLAERITVCQQKADRAAQLTRDSDRSRATLAEAVAALATARSHLADLTTLDEQIAAARGRLAAARTNIDRHSRQLYTAEAQQQTIETAQQQLNVDQAAAGQIRQTVELLRTAERMYGPNGAPALLVEAIAVPQIETEANRLLQLMPTSDGITFQVRLETQRQLRNGDLAEALDIVISDGLDERHYETFSGGEQARINLCLRIGLARLLAHRRGTGSRLLCVDELEYLDQHGQEQLVDVIRAVEGSFDTVLVVSHSPNVRDAFDQVIELDKTGGRSRIATHDHLEVPA